jgi:AcrR family transcriptional regulator
LDLFPERGYDGVGIQEIVDKSGITKLILHRYFGSKFGSLKILLSEKTADIGRCLDSRDGGYLSLSKAPMS